jgi:hypothetical protein
MKLIGEPNSGKPPSIGWWPTGNLTLRWWNGEFWSWPCIDSDSESTVRYYSAKRDEAYIVWYPRPESWPERSKT